MTRPIVGVTMDFLPVAAGKIKYTLYERYHLALRGVGAMVVALPPEPAAIDEQLALVSAVLLPGGDDLAPSLWGEEPAEGHVASDPRRTEHEMALVRACMARDVPLFGICLGAQTLNVACGGSLHQCFAEPARHIDEGLGLELRHDVAIAPDTLLARALGMPEGGRVVVNSSHRCAPNALGRDLVASAVAEDGVIEAIEHPGLAFCLGVQWHAEAGAAQDPVSRALLGAFVQAAAGR